jgi:hypothetical protein
MPVGIKMTICDRMSLRSLKTLPKSDYVQYTEDYNAVFSSDDGRWLFRAVALCGCQKLAYLLYSQEAVFAFSRPFQAYSFLGAFAELQKTIIGFATSVRMEQPGSHWTGFFMKFDIWVFFENLPRDSAFY